MNIILLVFFSGQRFLSNGRDLVIFTVTDEVSDAYLNIDIFIRYNISITIR